MSRESEAEAMQAITSNLRGAFGEGITRDMEFTLLAAEAMTQDLAAKSNQEIVARVWPGVNQRALANAFQGLSAQTVSLGRCDVRVNGATARAECAGTASWTIAATSFG